MNNLQPAWKKYRENLKEQLTDLRGKKWWKIPFKSGKALAQNLLAEKQETDRYQDAKEKKFEHFRTKQGIEIIENSLEEGNINIDIKYTRAAQKWILAINPNTEKAFFVSKNLDYHRNLLRDVKDNNSDESHFICLGGGQVNIDNKQNKIHLYGGSFKYGEIKKKLHPYLIKALEKRYPNYEIMFELP